MFKKFLKKLIKPIYKIFRYSYHSFDGIVRYQDFLKKEYLNTLMHLGEDLRFHRKQWEYVGIASLSRLLSYRNSSVLYVSDNFNVSLVSFVKNYFKNVDFLNFGDFSNLNSNKKYDLILLVDQVVKIKNEEYILFCKKVKNHLTKFGVFVYNFEINLSDVCEVDEYEFFTLNDIRIKNSYLRKIGLYNLTRLSKFCLGFSPKDYVVDEPIGSKEIHLKIKRGNRVVTSGLSVYTKCLYLYLLHRLFALFKKPFYFLKSLLNKRKENISFSSNSNLFGNFGGEYTRLLENIAFTTNLAKNSACYLVDVDGTTVTRIFTGQKMFVNAKDLSLAPHIILDGQWETEITNLIMSYIKEDTVFFDVGANFGWFSVVAGTKIRNGFLHVFEVNKKLSDLIYKSFLVNGIRNFKVNTIAVSNKDNQSITFNMHNDLWGSNFVSDKVTGFDSQIQVPTITLDTYCKENNVERVDVIKMDIEGHEDFAYEGMKDLIKRNKNNLVMFLEFSSALYSDSKDFFNKLKSDFTNIKALENGHLLREVKDFEHLMELSKGDWIMLILHN